MTITLVYNLGLLIGFALGWQVYSVRVAVRDRERARVASAKKQHIEDEEWKKVLQWRK